MAPIHDAIRAGDVEAVRRELAAGVSPDLRAKTLNSFPYDLPNSIPVWTPLCIALVYRESYESALEMVLLLIEAGADVDAVCDADDADAFRYTAIWLAAHSGRRNLVAALIAAGASTSLHVEGGSCPHAGLWNSILMAMAILAISCISFGSSCGLALRSRVWIGEVDLAARYF